jgi:hypothetical protein
MVKQQEHSTIVIQFLVLRVAIGVTVNRSLKNLKRPNLGSDRIRVQNCDAIYMML